MSRPKGSLTEAATDCDGTSFAEHLLAANAALLTLLLNAEESEPCDDEFGPADGCEIGTRSSARASLAQLLSRFNANRSERGLKTASSLTEMRNLDLQDAEASLIALRKTRIKSGVRRQRYEFDCEAHGNAEFGLRVKLTPRGELHDGLGYSAGCYDERGQEIDDEGAEVRGQDRSVERSCVKISYTYENVRRSWGMQEHGSGPESSSSHGTSRTPSENFSGTSE